MGNALGHGPGKCSRRSHGAAEILARENDGIAELSACGDRFMRPLDPEQSGWTPIGSGPVNGLGRWVIP